MRGIVPYLLGAGALYIPASFMSACDSCGELSGGQAAARATVAFSPLWLLALAGLAFRFRIALVVLAVAATAMALVTATLATDGRAAFESLGLSRATGFAIYAIPFAAAALTAWWGLRTPGPPSQD